MAAPTSTHVMKQDNSWRKMCDKWRKTCVKFLLEAAPTSTHVMTRVKSWRKTCGKFLLETCCSQLTCQLSCDMWKLMVTYQVMTCGDMWMVDSYVDWAWLECNFGQNIFFKSIFEGEVESF